MKNFLIIWAALVGLVAAYVVVIGVLSGIVAGLLYLFGNNGALIGVIILGLGLVALVVHQSGCKLERSR